jgi:hypothetical protein
MKLTAFSGPVRCWNDEQLAFLFWLIATRYGAVESWQRRGWPHAGGRDEFLDFCEAFAAYMSAWLRVQGVSHSLTPEAVLLRVNILLAGVHGWTLDVRQWPEYERSEQLAMYAGLIRSLPQGPSGWTRP